MADCIEIAVGSGAWDEIVVDGALIRIMITGDIEKVTELKGDKA